MCAVLLDKLRLYFDKVAAGLFAPSIASAAQTMCLISNCWRHALTVDHSFFADINGITDWTYDCEILSGAYVPLNYCLDCTLDEGFACCPEANTAVMRDRLIWKTTVDPAPLDR